MANTNEYFKVGDKVRIDDVFSILSGENHFYNGMVTEVLSVDSDGDIYLEDIKGAWFLVFSSEFHAIEKVTDKSSEDRRMAAIEKRLIALNVKVSELQAEVLSALDLLENDSDEVEEETANSGGYANERRAEVIEKAKEFVKEVSKFTGFGQERERKHKGFVEPQYVTDTEFIVDEEKRTVVALAKGLSSGRVRGRGIAKCNPDDVFNVHIGKAIAMGRAYGLDVSEFENAPQPDEVVPGMVVQAKESGDKHTVTKLRKNPNPEMFPGQAFFVNEHDWAADSQVEIISDTDAEYTEGAKS